MTPLDMFFAQVLVGIAVDASIVTFAAILLLVVLSGAINMLDERKGRG